jgi:hypothetical protein
MPNRQPTQVLRLSHAQDGWLDLERLAQVEITSENADHPLTKKSRITALISTSISR